MPRAPFQILVFPFTLMSGLLKYCVFSRSDYNCWQGIAGGGEDTETPLQAAIRESHEEANIPKTSKIIQLQTITSIPVNIFKASHLWDDSLYVIPEYSFGVEIVVADIKISNEHRDYKFVVYDEAMRLLKYEGNKTALWELNRRILGVDPRLA